jgi:hypothetical protein
MKRFVSFCHGLFALAALHVVALGSPQAAAEEVPFYLAGTFAVVDFHGHQEKVLMSGTSTPGDAFKGIGHEKYKHHMLRAVGTGTLDYGGGHSLNFAYDIFFNPQTGRQDGPYLITGGTGMFAGATGDGIMVADYSFEGAWELVGTLSL